jgi:ABC-type transporter Mla MlaB component
MLQVGNIMAAIDIVEDRMWSEFNFHKVAERKITIVSFRSNDLRLPARVMMLEHECELIPVMFDDPRLIVDFTGVYDIPTAVLGLLLQLIVETRDKGISVRLTGMVPAVRKMFGILVCKELVSVYDDLTDAILIEW